MSPVRRLLVIAAALGCAFGCRLAYASSASGTQEPIGFSKFIQIWWRPPSVAGQSGEAIVVLGLEYGERSMIMGPSPLDPVMSSPDTIVEYVRSVIGHETKKGHMRLVFRELTTRGISNGLPTVIRETGFLIFVGSGATAGSTLPTSGENDGSVPTLSGRVHPAPEIDEEKDKLVATFALRVPVSEAIASETP